MAKISSLDDGYETGDLSYFPDALDDKESLYEVKNNAETKLTQSLGYNGKYVIVSDASGFPAMGLLRIGPPPGEKGESELLHYRRRTDSIFSDLTRGFAGSRQNSWSAGAYVSNAVMAEHHNAVKDAVLNIEKTLGTSVNPAEDSLNGILKSLEVKFLAPKPTFISFPLIGPPPLKVTFQNYSGGDAIRYLWDFGDGTTSVEKSPNHTYYSEGIYTVRLNVITSTGAQGIATKKNYIRVDNQEVVPFFYAEEVSPGTFMFVDQTDGEIIQRFWVFDDGEVEGVSDPNIHTITHTYSDPGIYNPSLLVIFSSQKFKRVFLKDQITVS